MEIKIYKSNTQKEYMETDWKIAVAAIIGLSIIASAVIFSGGGDIAGFFALSADDKEPTGFSAQLKIENDVALDVAESDSVSIQLHPQDASIQLGREKLESSVDSVNIRIEGFAGKIVLGGKFSVKGSGKKVFLNGIGSKDRTSISVESDDFDQFGAVNASLRPINYRTRGTVNVQGGKGIIKVDNEEVQIGGFVGKLSAVPAEVSFDGEAEKISVAGKINIG